MNEKAIAIIKHFEGIHDGDLTKIGLQPKMCPGGVWTIGYGHAVMDPITHKYLKGEKDKERAYELAGTITEAEAEEYLIADYSRIEASVKHLVIQRAEDYEIGAMTSLAFNIGIGNFADSSVLRYFNKCDKATAAESFKLWVKCDGKVLRGLQRRRAAERMLFLKNKVKF